MAKTDRKNKIQHPYTRLDLYNHYLTLIDPCSDYYVDSEIYHRIVGEYYKAAMRKMIKESKTIKLPWRLGHIYIGKQKPIKITGRNVGIDWIESKRLGRWIRYSNDHTAGFKFRFHWTKTFCTAVNREFYRFIPTRENKRTLAKVIKSGTNDYLEIRK